MHHSDHSGFIKFMRHFPEQIRESALFLSDFPLSKISTEFQNIVVNGMGGSAIAGDILSACLLSELSVPFIVNRNYHAPNFVNKHSLVFSCSYSGNTEETLSATREALDKKATVVALSTGGQLEKLARENDLPFIKIPGGFPPRQALGYMYFPILQLLEKMEVIKPKQKEIQDTIHTLEELRERNDPERTHGHSLANQIAQKLYHRIPLLYTASDCLQPVVVRWRNQFNENSKILAYSNVFPELNHNEIMGWEASSDLVAPFSILMLRDADENPRNRTRLEITRNLLHKKDIPIFEIFTEGNTRMSRIFSMIYLGDWVSYYLALLYNKDPYLIESIQLLKEKLSQTN